MEDKPSERVVEQRLRNRIMEAIHSLGEGVGRWGAMEYFDSFYDFMDDRQPPLNSSISEGERQALAALCALVNSACDATPADISDRELTASGWPDRIKPMAVHVLNVFLKRGRFDEEIEQTEPSIEEGQAWYALASH